MTSPALALGGPAPAAQAWSGLSLEWVDPDGGIRREPLRECCSMAFERVAPVRSFTSYRGQRNWPGLWWVATMGVHVGFESWLERDEVMQLDFDRDVVAFASQPFWLLFTGGNGRPRSHAPDFFARRLDGSAVVIDCRPDERIRARDAESFEVTARACELVGWEYRRAGAADAVRVENVRWLAGYRHPRFANDATTACLLTAFAAGLPLMEGAESVGPTIMVVPALFHLLWQGKLTVDLSVPLSDTSTVWTTG